MYIYGDFDSSQARLIQMQLVKCTGHSYCKPQSEITEFLRNKWMLFFYNEKVFDQDFYQHESFKELSQIKWISVNTQWQQTLEYKFTMTEVSLQDMVVNLDDLTKIKNDGIFQIEKVQTRTYEKNYDVQMDITVEMNLSVKNVERAGYSFFDLLSDVGGMQGLLISCCGIILTIYKLF